MGNQHPQNIELIATSSTYFYKKCMKIPGYCHIDSIGKYRGLLYLIVLITGQHRTRFMQLTHTHFDMILHVPLAGSNFYQRKRLL